MAALEEVTLSKATGRHVTVHTIGSGGVEDLSSNIDDAELSWGLLRCQTGEGAFTRETIVAVVCHGADMPSEEDGQMSFSSVVLQLLGTADVTLHVRRGQELPEQLSTALASMTPSLEDPALRPGQCNLSAEQAVNAVGNELSPYNWVLLEPTGLNLHRAGCGGLDELKECLLSDKVMFGLLQFSFPRSDGAPPIVKNLFIHWIGPKVSVVRRGQWNSKLEEAALKIRESCDFAFRKTAYVLDDLDLPQLIEELGRVTCVTSSDTRQLTADWYLEGLQIMRQEIQATPVDVFGQMCNDESQSDSKPILRESAKHAIRIVREKGRQWKWVLLTHAGHWATSGGA